MCPKSGPRLGTLPNACVLAEHRAAVRSHDALQDEILGAQAEDAAQLDADVDLAVSIHVAVDFRDTVDAEGAQLTGCLAELGVADEHEGLIAHALRIRVDQRIVNLVFTEHKSFIVSTVFDDPDSLTALKQNESRPLPPESTS